MKNILNKTLCVGVAAAFGACSFISCTDTWNDHFDPSGSTKFDGTLMQAIEAKAPDFAEVIKAVGFDRELNSDNVYTVWTPESFNKDSLLALAKTDSADVVDRFIKNHIARYAISATDEEQTIQLMSDKSILMTPTKFGTSSLDKTNISCKNGVIHTINSNVNYQYNIFELIEHQYKTSTYQYKDQPGGSLYSFLRVWNKDSLDENRSVSRGVDENGNKIWVDSVVIRNNTVLNNVDALVYEEDSSYLAIIPSDRAYHERYNIYKDLLKFNPSEDVKLPGSCDSLQNFYANMLTINDLFFNLNANEHMEDSLKSTTYYSNGPIYGVYYRKDKKNQPAERPTHDILKGLTPTACSNGTAYVVDEFPMTAFEQSYESRTIMANNRYVAETSNDKGVGLYTKYCGDMSASSGTFEVYGTKTVTVLDSNGNDSIAVVPDSTKDLGTRSYYFFDVVPQGSNNPSIAFFIPYTLSGTYDFYLVTCPIWAKTGFNNGERYEDDPRPYRFKAYVWERNENGEYPKSGDQLIPPSGEKQYVTDATNPIDTLYLGEHTFNYTYYSRGYNENQAGVMLQISSQITNSQKNNYSREMLISKIIMRPKFVATDEQAAKKRNRK